MRKGLVRILFLCLIFSLCAFCVSCANRFFKYGSFRGCDEILKNGYTYEFELLDDESGYIVKPKGENGACADKKITLPSTYNSKPVKVLDLNNYYDFELLQSIVIHKNITEIVGYEDAYTERKDFKNIYYLGKLEDYLKIKGLIYLTKLDQGTGKRLYFNNKLVKSLNIHNLESIPEYAFYNCTSIKEIKLGGKVKKIGENAFYNCNVAFNTYQNNSLKYLGNDENPYFALIYTVDNKISQITISPDTRVIADNAFYECYLLKQTALPTNLTAIGNYAFYKCNMTSKIFIPDSVTFLGEGCFLGNSAKKITIGTGITEIPNKCFLNSNNLTEISLKGNIVSIGNSAFYSCDNITSFTIPNSVKTLGTDAFNDCDKLETINYSGALDEWVEIKGLQAITKLNNLKKLLVNGSEITNNVNLSATVINDYAFYNNQTITNLTLSDSVKEIGEFCFSGCKNLSDVTFGGEITTINANAFNDCSALKSLSIETGIFEIKEKAFYNCVGLTNLKMGDKVKIIGNNAFENCSSLENIIFGANVESVGDECFKNCITLKTVSVNNSICEMGKKCFYQCYELKTFTIPENIKKINEYSFAFCKSLNAVELGENVETISRNAFYDCVKLQDVVLNDKLKLIEESAFGNCESLTNVNYKGTANDYLNIKNLKNLTNTNSATLNLFFSGEKATVISINCNVVQDYAFYNCDTLKSVTLENVKNIGNKAFANCDVLENVILKNCKKIHANAFNESNSIKYNEYSNGFYFGNSDNPYYYLIKAKDKEISECIIHKDTQVVFDNCFNGCNNLTTLTLPNEKVKINESALKNCPNLNYAIYDNALYLGSQTNPYLYLIKAKNSVITSCVIHEGAKYVFTQAFASCTSLTAVTFPDSVEEIGSYAFLNCTSLSEVKLSQKLKVIEECAFYNCKSLTNLTFNENLSEIKKRAFYNCSALKKVTLGNVNGWKVSFDEEFTNPIEVEIDKLIGDNNGKTFYSTYCNYYWKKT